MANYSVLQRARSYAELARWMGRTPEEKYPGLVVVGTMTTDLPVVVLDDKEDRDKAVPRLRARGREADLLTAVRAEAGMQLLEHGVRNLADPDSEMLLKLYGQLKAIHSEAYGWDAPDISHDIGHGATARIRSYVRRWINEWDLRRLYPDTEPEIEETEFTLSYEEDTTLERAHSEDNGTRAAGEVNVVLPIPFQDTAGEEATANVVYLRFMREANGGSVQGALFVTNGRGNPLEFCFTRVESGSGALWEPGRAYREAVTALVRALFEAVNHLPDLVFALAEETPFEIFADDMKVQVPACLIGHSEADVATLHWIGEEPVEGTALASLVESFEVPSVVAGTLSEGCPGTGGGLRALMILQSWLRKLRLDRWSRLLDRSRDGGTKAGATNSPVLGATDVTVQILPEMVNDRVSWSPVGSVGLVEPARTVLFDGQPTGSTFGASASPDDPSAARMMHVCRKACCPGFGESWHHHIPSCCLGLTRRLIGRAS